MVEQAMDPFQFECPKCASTNYMIGEMRGPSGGFIAFMDIDDVHLTLVACRNCGYAETYLMSKKDFIKSRGIEE